MESLEGTHRCAIPGSVFFHHAVLIGFLSLTIGFGSLIAPSPEPRSERHPPQIPDAAQAANHSLWLSPGMKKIEMPEGEGKAIAENVLPDVS